MKTFYLALVPEQVMTPFSGSKFDCAVQSRDVRENRALRDLSEISRGGGGVGLLNLGSEIR